MPTDASPRFATDIPAAPRAEVADLLKDWLDPSDYRSCAVSILAGGAVNQNFLVTAADGRRSVLRLAPPPPVAEALGVDMANSLHVAKLAGQAAAGPRVFNGRLPQGHSLIEFLEGMLDVHTIHRADAIEAIGKAVRKVHELPPAGVRAKTAFEDIEEWMRGAREQGALPHDQAAAVRPRLEACREILDGIEGSCVSHRDLNPQNCAWADGVAKIIDWDFSAVDSPYLDLAMLIDYAELDPAEARIFVAAAIGEPTDADMARIAVMRLVNSIREWSWTLQAAGRLEGKTNTLTELLPGGGSGHEDFYSGYIAVNWRRIEGIGADPAFEEACRVARSDLPAPGHR